MRSSGEGISLTANGVRTRLDLYVRLPNGKKPFIEVETGPKAGFTRNQRAAFDTIRTEGAYTNAPKAAQAGIVGRSSCPGGETAVAAAVKSPTTLAAESLVAPLKAAGFRKRTAGFFTVELAPDALGLVSLNTASENTAPGTVRVNPIVGVRHQEVERVLAELRNETPHAYMPATVQEPVGYVMPQRTYTTWMFSVDDDMGEPAAEIARAVEDHGLPFMRDAAALERVVALLREGRTATREQFLLPVALALAGDTVAALDAVAATEREVEGQRGPFATAFRTFAERFRERFD